MGCHLQLRQPLSFRSPHLHRRLSWLPEKNGPGFQTHSPSPQFPKSSVLTWSWPNFTNSTPCPRKSSIEPRLCPCTSKEETWCSKTRSASSKCPPVLLPQSFLPSLFQHSGQWRLHRTLPAKEHYDPKVCPSNEPKNWNDGMQFKIPSTYSIYKSNS